MSVKPNFPPDTCARMEMLARSCGETSREGADSTGVEIERAASLATMPRRAQEGRGPDAVRAA